jgi:hypothetical protein
VAGVAARRPGEEDLGSLAFGEIERWEKAIKKRISARGTPYAPSVASGARSLLITILGDAVHAGKIKTNPAERRKGRRGKVKAKGRRGPSYAATQTPKNNVLTPLQATCLAERCALMSGRDIDFVMNVFAAWTGVRWGELMAVEGSEDKDSPLQLPDSGIGTYALDWQLLDVARLRQGRAMAGHPGPQGQPQVPGSRPGRRHLAQPHGPRQAARLPAHALNDPGKARSCIGCNIPPFA